VKFKLLELESKWLESKLAVSSTSFAMSCKKPLVRVENHGITNMIGFGRGMMPANHFVKTLPKCRTRLSISRSDENDEETHKLFVDL
jgi:5-methylcytosine-specific restriction endonuclease McrBC regulatory subunit McrC